MKVKVVFDKKLACFLFISFDFLFVLSSSTQFLHNLDVLMHIILALKGHLLSQKQTVLYLEITVDCQ